MTETKEPALVTLIREHLWGLRAITRGTWQMESCIPTSTTLATVLNGYGIIAYPLVARVVLMDKITASIIAEHGGDHFSKEIEQTAIDQGGKVVMMGFPNKEEGETMGGFTDEFWIGHMVTILFVAGDWYLLDLTLDQSNKIKEITIDPLIGKVSPGFLTGDGVILPLPGGELIYYQSYPDDKTYLETGGYIGLVDKKRVETLMVAYLDRYIVTLDEPTSRRTEIITPGD